jgi:hypothetical protein
VDNIKVDLRVIGWGGMHWIYLFQDRDQWIALVSTVMNLRVPYNFWKILGQLQNWLLLKKGAQFHKIS